MIKDKSGGATINYSGLYIDHNMLEQITNLGIERIDSHINVSAFMSQAQKEFEYEVGRTFNGSETDYNIAQRAVAYLTAYYIRKMREEIDYAESNLRDYKRYLNMLRGRGNNVDVDKPIYFTGAMTVVTSADIADEYIKKDYRHSQSFRDGHIQ